MSVDRAELVARADKYHDLGMMDANIGAIGGVVTIASLAAFGFAGKFTPDNVEQILYAASFLEGGALLALALRGIQLNGLDIRLRYLDRHSKLPSTLTLLGHHLDSLIGGSL